MSQSCDNHTISLPHFAFILRVGLRPHPLTVTDIMIEYHRSIPGYEVEGATFFAKPVVLDPEMIMVQ
jgi:hypothetical protein